MPKNEIYQNGLNRIVLVEDNSNSVTSIQFVSETNQYTIDLSDEHFDVNAAIVRLKSETNPVLYNKPGGCYVRLFPTSVGKDQNFIEANLQTIFKGEEHLFAMTDELWKATIDFLALKQEFQEIKESEKRFKSKLDDFLKQVNTN